MQNQFVGGIAIKKLILTLTTLVLMLTLGVAAVAEPSIFEGGNGTAENPYQIATVEQLMAFAASVNDGSTDGYAGQSIVLTAGIDAAEMDWQPIGRMDLENMSDMSMMFAGTFDGQGHKIFNVRCTMDTAICGAGVFGINLGEVRNLVVENVDVRCTDIFSMAIGGAVGYTWVRLMA